MIILAAACAFAFSSCVKEVEAPVQGAEAEFTEETPVEIVADLGATRTAIDNQFKVTWEEGDAVGIFHVEQGTENFVNDGKFVVKEAGSHGVFTGTVKGTFNTHANYDWYIIYPYKEDYTSPKDGVIRFNYSDQAGNDSFAHLAGENFPLYGVVKGVPGRQYPLFQLHQMLGVFAVTFVNVDREPWTPVAVVAQTVGSEKIQMMGTFNVDLTGDAPAFTPFTGEGNWGPKQSWMNIAGAKPIEKGKSATFYFPVVPNTFTNDNALQFTSLRQTQMGRCINLSQPLTIKSGDIQKITINLSGEEYLTEAEAAEPILFKFCEANDYTSGYCTNHDGQMGDAGSRPRWHSSIDCNPFHMIIEDEMTVPKAYLTYDLIAKTEVGSSAGRFRLFGMSLSTPGPRDTKNDIYAKAYYGKIPVGKKVAFYSSIMINTATAPDQFQFSVSYDGGKTYAPATVEFNEEYVDSYDAATATIDFKKSETLRYLCYPVKISGPAAAADLEKAQVFVKINVKKPAAGWASLIAIAPYYKYTTMEGLRVYTNKLPSNNVDVFYPKKILVPDMNLDPIEKCAYLTLE